MATIQDINAASGYVGNAALGGGTLGSFQLDVTPLQNLAVYTMKYNERQFDDNQKKIEAAAKEMAVLTQYDLNLAPEKDRKQIEKEWKEDLFDWVKQNPDALDYTNNPEKWMEYHKRKSRFEDHLTNGKARTAMYGIREKEVAETTNAKLKAIRKKKLDDEVNATTLSDPLKHSQKYDIAPIPVKAAARKKFDVTQVGYNMIGKREYDARDFSSISSQAASLEIGMIPPDQQPDWGKLKDEDKEWRKLEWEEQVAAGRTEPIETTKNYNIAWQQLKVQNPEFFNADGTVKADAVINSGKNPISSIVSLAETYNAAAREERKLIKEGAFSDNFRKEPIQFGTTPGLNEADYAEINVKDGLTTQEYLKLKIFSISEGTKYETDTKVTGLGIKQELADIAKLKGRAYANNLNAKTAKLKKDSEKEAVMEDLWYQNLMQQPTLTRGLGGNTVSFEIKAASSTPIFTYSPTGKPTQLIPYGAKKVYDKMIPRTMKLKSGGKEVTKFLMADGTKTDNPSEAEMVPAPNAKLLYTVGGVYRNQYIDPTKNNKQLSPQDLSNFYDKFKDDNPNWQGSYDDYLKQGARLGEFDVRMLGENGTSTKKVHMSAQMSINNAISAGKEENVFETLGEDDNPSEVTGIDFEVSERESTGSGGGR